MTFFNQKIFCDIYGSKETFKSNDFLIKNIENATSDSSKAKSPIYANNIRKLNCSANDKDILVEIYKDNYGNFKGGQPKIFELFNNQLQYVFNVTIFNGKIANIYPCGIFKFYFDIPIISVKNCTESITYYGIGKICVVKKTFVSQSFKPSLKHIYDETNKFYSNDSLFYSIASFERGNTLLYNDKPKKVTEEIIIESYNIINISYNCGYCGSNRQQQRIDKIIFFGPKNPNMVIYSEMHGYNNGTLGIIPNCTIKKYVFAYLEKVSFEKTIVHVNTLINSHNGYKNGFQLFENSTVHLKNGNPEGTLRCYFKTPTYYILEEYKFKQVISEYFFHLTNQKIIIKKDFDQDLYKKGKIKLTNDKTNSLSNQKNTMVDITRKINSFNLISIILLIGLVIIIIFLISFLMYNLRRRIAILTLRVRARRNHWNIYVWWESMLSQDWLAYCNLIHSESYIPEKVLANNGKTFIYEGEEIECNIDELFRESLVDTQKSLDHKISAHYIFTRFSNKKYILSDHPTKQMIQQFWELLLNEKVSVVIAFLYKYPKNKCTASWEYWLSSNVNYGYMNVTKEETQDYNLKNISVYAYRIKNINNGKERTVNIFHVERWKEHTPPESTSALINLYNVVNKIAGDQRILITSRHGAGSTMFIYIYFACIIEYMISDKSIVDPLQIVKIVRESRYGGAIGTHEFSYIIAAIIDYFYSNKILVDKKPYSLFVSKVSNYMEDIFSLISDINSEMKAFFYFSIILDQGIVNQMYVELKKAGNLDKKSLNDLCKNWYKVEKDPQLSKKNRYHDIPCFDANSIFSNSIDSKNQNISKYINANELSYDIKEGFQRKLILCQAPTESTVNGIVEMMFKKNVGTLVLLAEQTNHGITWLECFPINSDRCSFDIYTVVKVTDYGTLHAGTHIVDFYITNGSKKVPFRLLHYKDWPERGKPLHAWEFLTLYYSTIDSAHKRPIAIQCPNGVGWTGTFALIIYMIDNIGKNCYYDPIKDLAFIRQFRNGAVQTEEQLMIAYIVLREHYRQYITDNQLKIYKWYKLFYKLFFYNPNQDPHLIWSNLMIKSAEKAGFDNAFEDEN
uniref:protein-tyrosine-phosphatase n=1 Tax=Strongyloides papillosus TaxID=174720 RepID=A0A0N5C8A6_STREA